MWAVAEAPNNVFRDIGHWLCTIFFFSFFNFWAAQSTWIHVKSLLYQDLYNLYNSLQCTQQIKPTSAVHFCKTSQQQQTAAWGSAHWDLSPNPSKSIERTSVQWHIWVLWETCVSYTMQGAFWRICLFSLSALLHLPHDAICFSLKYSHRLNRHFSEVHRWH